MPEPVNIYGWSKAHAEKNVKKTNENALIIRTSAFFGPWDEYNFVTQLMSNLRSQREYYVLDDARVSPTYVPDLVNHALDLLIDDESGIWHLSNEGDVSWWELATEIARYADLDTSLLRPVSLEAMNLKATRPGYSVLSSEKGCLMPSLENALQRYFTDVDEYSKMLFDL